MKTRPHIICSLGGTATDVGAVVHAFEMDQLDGGVGFVEGFVEGRTGSGYVEDTATVGY